MNITTVNQLEAGKFYTKGGNSLPFQAYYCKNDNAIRIREFSGLTSGGLSYYLPCREATKEEIEHYHKSFNEHCEVMTDYYNKNVYTGD
jgi:hypothetical protein